MPPPPPPPLPPLPRPRLVCRVGVFGHRPERLRENGADLAQIQRRAAEVLDAIAEAVFALHGERVSPYSDRAPGLRVISPLAEGSDRILARAGLERSPNAYELHCVFPFAVADYRRDFTEQSEMQGAESAQEFDALRARATAVLELDSERGAPNAYAAVGLTLVRQSDLLLTVWDGAPARGPGGTPEIVVAALSANIPVIAIDARRDRQHAPALLELQQGAIAWRPWSTAELLERLRTVLQLAPRRRGADRSSDSIAPEGNVNLAYAYFDEPGRSLPRAGLYERLTRRLARLTGDPELHDVLTPELSAFVRSAADSAHKSDSAPGRVLTRETHHDVPAEERSAAFRELVERLERAVGGAFAWADVHADRYAALHRRHLSRATLLLVPIAVVMGYLVQRCVSAEMTGESGGAAALRVVMSGVEFAALVLVFDSYVTVRRLRAHDRWLDYRSIAEKLRHVMVLLPLGRPGIEAELPATLSENDARAHWTNWYLRALIRETGVFAGKLGDASYRQACATLLRHWLVRGQLRYHYHAELRAHAPLDLLHRVRYLMFAFVLAAPITHFVLEPIPQRYEHERLLAECLANLVFFCVPAIYASCYAFVRLADFENIEVRARAEVQRLTRVEGELKDAADRSSVDLLRAATMTSHLMFAELVEWRVAAALREPDLSH